MLKYFDRRRMEAALWKLKNILVDDMLHDDQSCSMDDMEANIKNTREVLEAVAVLQRYIDRCDKADELLSN